jgi:hypothetical protein
MARKTAELQQSEIAAFQAFAVQQGIKIDGDEGVRNGEILGGAIINADQEISLATLSAAFQQVHNQLAMKSSAEREYDGIAAENPAAAGQLAAWFTTQGKPGALINTGDEYFANMSMLLAELRGREVNSQRIHEAMGRISYRPGRQLHSIPMPRIVNGRQHKDDGSGFLGKNVNMSPSDYKRQAEAAYAEKPATPAKSKGPADAWETVCNDLLRFGTHSAQANMRELYDRGIQQGKSFREIYAEMNTLKASYQRLISTAKY